MREPARAGGVPRARGRVGVPPAFDAIPVLFRVDWEHRFEPGFPLYLQVSRDGLVLHLSEHHGDGSPGRDPAPR